LWADHLKKIKAPRKKKVKSADQLIQRLKYMKGDADLKLTSIEPTKLIGASEAWIFNVKTRRVDHYFSNDADGISIKGSTLQNINETTSIAKKIRKPLEVSKNIVMGTSRGATKYFDAIKTKPIKSTGRLNAFSIILRVV
jgi:heptaprenylglyceryl phosphate synthase